MKKGQITKFILLGLMILFASVLWIIFSADKSRMNLFSYKEDYSAFNDLEYCIQNNAEELMVLFGMEGGNMKIIFESDGSEMPVKTYLKNREKRIPQIKELQDNFSIAMLRIIPLCLDEYNKTIVNKGSPKVDTLFTKNSVLISVSYPIEIELNGKIQSFKDFRFEIPVRIPHYLEIAEEIIDSIIEDPGWFDIIQLGDYDVGVHVLSGSPDIFIIQLNDLIDSSINKSFIFSFGIIFSSDSNNKNINNKNNNNINKAPLFINLDSNYTVKVNQTLKKDIHALDLEQSNLIYMVDAPYIDLFIDRNTGVFVFTPNEKDIGVHFITFYVNDGHGGWTEKEVKIEVIK